MIGTKILEKCNSKYNGNLLVVKTFGMGTYIQSNGLTQSGGIVETIWRQTIRKLKFQNLKPKTALILGLGGGTVAKLIRKKWPNAKITGVEIDPIMIELGNKYLGLDKLNVKLFVGDAFDYLTHHSSLTDHKYDLVIVDLYNGDIFPEKFESDKYLIIVKRNLSDFGTVIFNRLYYGDKRSQAVKFGNRLEIIFDKVKWFYPEANLMFLCKNKKCI